MSDQKTTLNAATGPTTITLGADTKGLPYIHVGPEVITDADVLRVRDALAAKYREMEKNRVMCLDCGWQGSDYQLKAQACPVCDGRVADC